MSLDLIEPEQRDVHGWFELTYSNFLVLHRSLMQSMPAEWQHRMVTCLDEIRQAFDHLEHPSFKVLTGKWCYLDDLSDSDMERLGITTGCEDKSDDHWCSPGECEYFLDGEELDPHTACVFAPAPDPIPHYNRGRTRVRRADEQDAKSERPETYAEAAAHVLGETDEDRAGEPCETTVRTGQASDSVGA